MPTALGLGFVPSALFRGFCFRDSFTSFESRKALIVWEDEAKYMTQVGVDKGNLAGSKHLLFGNAVL